MRTVILSLKGIRIRWVSFTIIIVQLAVCFAILIYSVCGLFGQFDIIYTANGANRGYLYLFPDLIYTDNEAAEFRINHSDEIPDFFAIYKEFLEEHGLTEDEGVTGEQFEDIRKEYTVRIDNLNDKYHVPDKYQYLDLYEKLGKSGLVLETASNYGTIVSTGSTAGGFHAVDEVYYSFQTVMMDEKLYDTLKMKTVRGINLHDYPEQGNYFYAVIYPNISIGENKAEEIPYGVGDIITSTIYNNKELRDETFYFEIVDELKDPAYVMPELSISGPTDNFATLERAFLNPQSMVYNSGLIVLKPESFDRMDYYMNIGENYTMIKPRENLTESEYSELMGIIRECGFNTINLDDAEQNSIAEIWEFISENCVIIALSILMVTFSIISTSVLSSGQIQREYAVYRLCGADLNKLKKLTAVKWAIVFIAAMIVGIILAAAYSAINSSSMHFVLISAIVSTILSVVLYFCSFLASYRSARGKTTELSI